MQFVRVCLVLLDRRHNAVQNVLVHRSVPQYWLVSIKNALIRALERVVWVHDVK